MLSVTYMNNFTQYMNNSTQYMNNSTQYMNNVIRYMNDAFRLIRITAKMLPICLCLAGCERKKNVQKLILLAVCCNRGYS